MLQVLTPKGDICINVNVSVCFSNAIILGTVRGSKNLIGKIGK